MLRSTTSKRRGSTSSAATERGGGSRAIGAAFGCDRGRQVAARCFCKGPENDLFTLCCRFYCRDSLITLRVLEYDFPRMLPIAFGSRPCRRTSVVTLQQNIVAPRDQALPLAALKSSAEPASFGAFANM